MKLLISGLLLMILSSLAMKVGLNAAILLWRPCYSLLIFNSLKYEDKRVYKTYEEWKKEEFPFWFVDTIKRVIRWLKTKGISFPRLGIIL